MNRIRVLEKQVAELIAAGEVVERPASAVKELLENSIDAGSTAITIEIKNGGVTYIRITDNGCGIPREDIETAFLRHATSKIKSENDLDAIGTLGFRGEALASIAAVSKIDIMTRTEEELAGTRLSLEGGEKIEKGDAGCPKGTTIIVRELFFNTPARMKFLKKDISEANAVAAVVERIALSHPEISVRFIKDGREELHTPGDSKLLSAVHSVLGKEFAGSLIPVEYEIENISVSGFITKPVASRPNRNMQFFFINGRLVKSKTAMAALEEAYKNSIMVGRCPGCVLHIKMNPSLVDVNVHPAKIEVRFVNEKRVFDAVYYAVKTTVETKDTRPVFSLHYGEEESSQPTPSNIADPSENKKPELFNINEENENGKNQLNFDIIKNYPKQNDEEIVANPVRTAYTPVQNPKYIAGDWAAKEETAKKPASATDIPEIKEKAEYKGADSLQRTDAPVQVPHGGKRIRVAGECFNTYIIAEVDDELWLIDKHAAHERMIFNEIRGKGASVSQLLLNPASVTLSREEYGAVLENKELLEKSGFHIDDFGGATVLVREAPMMLRGSDIVSALEEIAGYLASNKKDAMPERLDWLYHSVACRSAVKAGDKSSLMELERIAKRVAEMDDIRYCPHGRPVAMILTRKGIEKQFGRT